MKAIIPVAGEGTRMRPYTYVRPKALLHVAGKPILSHILDKLIDHGIDDVTLIIGHLGSRIKEYLDANYDIPLHYVEQTKRMGSAHALYLAREYMGDEPLLIVLGDTIFELDLEPVLSGKTTSLGVKEVEDPRRFGVVILKDGLVRKVVEKPEKPESNLALVGMYFFHDPSLLRTCIEEMIEKEMKTRGEYQLTDAIEMMIKGGHDMTTFAVEQWFDCGKPEALLETNRHLLDLAGHRFTIQGSIIHPPVFIDDSAVIESSIVGPHVSVAAGARVRHSIVRDSIIGEEASLSNAILNTSLVGDKSIVEGTSRMLTIGDMSEIKT